MATQILKCERHGQATRLTCVECGQPICPRCSVRTGVGLKCEHCAQPTSVPEAALQRRRLPLVLALAGAVAVLAALGLFLLRPSGPAEGPAAPLPPVGQWASAPDLTAIRGTTTAVMLEDGRVLAAGGGVGAIPLAAGELFEGDGWTRTGGLTQARRGHQAVVLDDGRVLVSGGIAGGELLASAEVYDPAVGTWTPTADMTTPRLGHTLTVLSNGRVLAAGGTALESGRGTAGGQTIRPEASAEIYDPTAGTWSPAGHMASSRFEHTATLLSDGRVLLVGGLGPVEGGLAPLASAELFDPAASAFVRTSDLDEPRTNHAAAVLPDRSVLIIGGAGGPNGDVSLASAELYDPRQGSWTVVESLAEPRTGHTASVLADGRVLVTGGETMSRGTRRSLDGAEVYDPADGTWRSAGTMACPRSEQAAVVLQDSSVLVVAGDATFPGQAPIAQSCADRYQP